MAHFAIKLQLVLWKNYLIWKRHYLFSIFEILMPLLMLSMLSFVYITSPKFNKVKINETEPHEAKPLDKVNWKVLYTPDTTSVKRFMDQNKYISDKVGFANEKDMEKEIKIYYDAQKEDKTKQIPVGVAFEVFPKRKYPHDLKYQIRTDSRLHVEMLFDSRPPRSEVKNNYFKKFIPTQQAIDMAFIEREHAKYDLNIDFKFTFILQEMQCPSYTIPGQLPNYIYLLPLWAILAFAFMFPSVLKRITEEQSTGIKEYMKMMGLDAWMLWFGWYIYSMAINIIVITIIALILSVYMSVNTRSIFENIEPSIIWIFLFMYCSASVCFCIFISTLFKKPILTMCMGMLIWLMTCCFFFYLVMDNDPEAYTFYWYFVLIWPNVCLGYGFKTLIDFEFKGYTGLTWSNFMEAPSKFGPHPSIGFACLILLIACVIFLLLSLYIENVFPGGHGIARPWYYLFTKSYWCTKKVSTSDGHLAHIEERDWQGFETVSADTPAAIQIRNLSKLFHKKAAIDNLSFDIYENEITVLLGHNGAGKTITMNIITGLSRTAAKLESEQFLSRLNMSSKANKMASELSGCMRRKLSLGMALVGHTRVLILDEPTSGLDPEARREIWDLLLSMRGERTILITTHYMLEADILGDRIAIMHHGQLMCHGTSLFLKNHYGTGYTLSLLVTNLWNIDTITAVIQGIIPNAENSISAGLVTFALPTNDTVALSALFSNLEMNKSRLSISSFCISLTTMEVVFLRVGEIAEEIDKILTNVCTCEPNRVLLTGPSLFCHQFLGLFIKRCQYARHRWIMILLQLLIPLALITIIMHIIKLSEHATTPVKRRDINLDQYKGSKAFSSFWTIISNDPSKTHHAEYLEYYRDVVESQGGKSTEVNSLPDPIFKFGVNDINQYHYTLIASAGYTRYGTWYPNKWDDPFKMNRIVVPAHIDLYPPVTFTAMYGELALHAAPIALNLVTNTALRMNNKNRPDKITVVNNPWPQFQPKSIIKLDTSAIIMWIFLFPTAFTIMVGFFLPFIHEERRTGVKHLQLMAGVPRVLYWTVIYLFDLLVYFAFCVLVIIVVISFNFKGPFGNGLSLWPLSSLMLLYGCAILPLAYIFTYTSTVATSVLFLIWFHVLFGIITTAIVFSLQFLGNVYKEMSESLTYAFYSFPNFAVLNGVYKSVTHSIQIYDWELLPKEKQKKICLDVNMTLPCCAKNSKACEEFYSYYTGEFSIVDNIIALAVLILAYFFILFLFESRMPRKYYGKLHDLCYDKNRKEPALNPDVAEEQLRIQNQINGVTRVQNDVLQVTNLRKYFDNFYAVRALNFGVKSGECVGLLGCNGAGKTTAFKMLTGEINPTTGTAKLMGYRLHGDRSTYLKKIGYCPQFDAFNLTLTCRETLQLFAYLRGVPSHVIRLHINKWVTRFDIKEYENISCRNLSGGNKRKLSTAVALIGNPPLVLLDVPTSGADPDARRILWVILAELRKFRQSVIITTHSMDECEALCDRLAIMVDGRLKNIGNIQYLKSKYRQGFTVMMKLKPVVAFKIDVTDAVFEIKSLKRKMETNYCCTLKDEHTGMLLYHVANRSGKLGEVFLFMEGLRSNVEILEDYIICDASLEQVFLSFVKYKRKNVGRCQANKNVSAAII